MEPRFFVHDLSQPTYHYFPRSWKIVVSGKTNRTCLYVKFFTQLARFAAWRAYTQLLHRLRTGFSTG